MVKAVIQARKDPDKTVNEAGKRAKKGSETGKRGIANASENNALRANQISRQPDWLCAAESGSSECRGHCA